LDDDESVAKAVVKISKGSALMASVICAVPGSSLLNAATRTASSQPIFCSKCNAPGPNAVPCPSFNVRA